MKSKRANHTVVLVFGVLTVGLLTTCITGTGHAQDRDSYHRERCKRVESPAQFKALGCTEIEGTLEPGPIERPAKPVEKPAKPVEKPAKPVEKPAKPVEKPAKPEAGSWPENRSVASTTPGLSERIAALEANLRAERAREHQAHRRAKRATWIIWGSTAALYGIAPLVKNQDVRSALLMTAGGALLGAIPAGLTGAGMATDSTPVKVAGITSLIPVVALGLIVSGSSLAF